MNVTVTVVLSMQINGIKYLDIHSRRAREREIRINCNGP